MDMARRLDRILVVDVESTCWDGPPPPGEESEIIEIGICQVDLIALEPVEKRALFIKPVHSRVSDFCTRLTTLTDDHLEGAGNLAQACRVLKTEYDAKNRLWASWGDYDRRQFRRVCEMQSVGYPFGRSHLNIKSLFAAAAGCPQEIGLDAAFSRLGWTMEGTHHRGDDDAWNISRILCHLLKLQRERLDSC